jgi:hypothetical protein
MPINRTQTLGLLGLLGSLLWLGLNTVLSPDWGPPGSANYLGYETISRLWAPAFALMLCGYMALYQRYPLRNTRLGRVGYRLAIAGLALMIAGNIAEFWFFSELPYGSLNARSWAWISVLLGMLALLIGTALLGLAGWRGRALPGWVLVLPAFLLLFFTQLIGGAWLALAVLGLAASALTLWPANAAMATKGTT